MRYHVITSRTSTVRTTPPTTDVSNCVPVSPVKSNSASNMRPILGAERSNLKAGSITRLDLSDLVPLNSETENNGISRGPPQLGAVQPQSSPDSTSSPYPIIGNRRSHIYHRPDCPQLQPGCAT